MKITKNYLKQVIKEEIQKLSQTNNLHSELEVLKTQDLELYKKVNNIVINILNKDKLSKVNDYFVMYREVISPINTVLIDLEDDEKNKHLIPKIVEFFVLNLLEISNSKTPDEKIKYNKLAAQTLRNTEYGGGYVQAFTLK